MLPVLLSAAFPIRPDAIYVIEERKIYSMRSECVCIRRKFGGSPARVNRFGDFVSLLLWVWESCTSRSLETFVMLSWALWSRRNAALFNGVVKDDELLLYSTLSLLEDFKACRSAVKKTPSISRVSSWKPPLQGLFSTSVDGAVSRKEGSSAFGFISRDFTGKLCTAKAGYFGRLYSHLETELRAIRESVCWSINAGFTERERS